MTDREEIEFSLTLSPRELVIWHGMGACVAPHRLPEMQAALMARSTPRPADGPIEATKKRPTSIAVTPYRHCEACPVEVYGKPYASMTAAAAAIGITRHTLRGMVRRGNARVMEKGSPNAAAAHATAGMPEVLGTLRRVDGDRQSPEQPGTQAAAGVHAVLDPLHDDRGAGDGTRPPAGGDGPDRQHPGAPAAGERAHGTSRKHHRRVRAA